jgi:hypothetical protein
MNTYFLSLIQPDREARKKNLACVYDLGECHPLIGCFSLINNKLGTIGEYHKQITKYIIGRFPLIKEGDYVKSPTSLWIWEGNCIEYINNCSFDTDQFHPSFFGLTKKPKMMLSSKERMKLASCHFLFRFESKGCYFVRSFRVRKVMYRLKIFLDNEVRIDDQRKWEILLERIKNWGQHYFYVSQTGTEVKLNNILVLIFSSSHPKNNDVSYIS